MLKFLQGFVKWFPVVFGGVLTVEQGLGSTVPGETKKQILFDIITAVDQFGQSIPEPHIKLISTLTDRVVTVLNAAGVFGHKAAPAPPVPQPAPAPGVVVIPSN